MKKILINMLPFNNHLKGTGYYIKRILFFLQKLDNKNQYILLFSNNVFNPKDLFNIYASNFIVEKHKEIKSIKDRIIYEQLKLPYRKDIDILFSPSTAIPIMPKKYKTITTIHDLTFKVLKNKYSGLRKIYVNTIMYWSAKKADKIITVSKNSKNDIVKFYGISEDKIEVIYNFLEENCIKEFFSIEKRDNILFSVSLIQPGKNLENLIKAFYEFNKINRNYKLYIIGEKGWGYQKVFELVNNLDLKDKVIFTGYLSEKELNNFYKKAKALVYISFYEGFGYPPLESMKYKTPVIVSNTSSLPEVVGKAGIFVDPYDVSSIVNGMKKILDNNYLKSLQRFMEKEVKKFNGEREVRKLLNIFNNL